MERTGKMHIYMGDGKGKTTAAVGLAVRCAGQGGNVMFAQFLKDTNSGELAVFEEMDHMQFIPAPGFFGFTWQMSPQEKEEAAALYGLYMDTILMRVQQSSCRMLVLDEIIGTVTAGLMAEDVLIDYLEQVPEEVEIVMTGRYPTEKLLALADYVTEMKKIRHPYEQGLTARAGIEY